MGDEETRTRWFLRVMAVSAPFVVALVVLTTARVAQAASGQADPTNDSVGQIESALIGVGGTILGGIIGYVGARRQEERKTKNKLWNDLEDAVFAYLDALLGELDAADTMKKLRAHSHTEHAAVLMLRLERRARRADIHKLIQELANLRNQVRNLSSVVDQGAYVQDHLPPLLDGLLEILRGEEEKQAA